LDEIWGKLRRNLDKSYWIWANL